VTFHGIPIVALAAVMVPVRAAAVAIGFGIKLAGYAAYSAAKSSPADALELHDARGDLISTTKLWLLATPHRERVLLVAYFRHEWAGVPALKRRPE
jgi:hypothetical protein